MYMFYYQETLVLLPQYPHLNWTLYFQNPLYSPFLELYGHSRGRSYIFYNNYIKKMKKIQVFLMENKI